jgi:hypothetical protein
MDGIKDRFLSLLPFISGLQKFVGSDFCLAQHFEILGYRSVITKVDGENEHVIFSPA